MSHNYLQLCAQDNFQRLIQTAARDPAASFTLDSESFATAAQELLDLWKSIPTGEQYLRDKGILELTESDQVQAFSQWIAQNPQIHALDTLVLRNWTHNTLPDALKLFPNLQTLDFHSAMLTEIPDLVFSLTQLQTLKIVSPLCNISSKICQLQSLRELSIQGSPMAALPLEVFQLPGLEVLDLSNNQLAALPDEVGNLLQLKKLSISKNHIGVLPETLGNCQKLETLHLSWNNLVKIPDSIWKLQKLRYLWSAHNQLTLLPDLEQSSNIETCNFDGNHLNAIPHKFFQQLPHLKQLYFRNNPLSSVPDVSQWNLDEVVF